MIYPKNACDKELWPNSSDVIKLIIDGMCGYNIIFYLFTQVAVSCEELNSDKFEVNYTCCLIYMPEIHGELVLHVHESYDGGEKIYNGQGRVRNLYSSVSRATIINNTRIWCSITDYSTTPPTITTCKHHVFTNNCQDQGNNMFI